MEDETGRALVGHAVGQLGGGWAGPAEGARGGLAVGLALLGGLSVGLPGVMRRAVPGLGRADAFYCANCAMAIVQAFCVCVWIWAPLRATSPWRHPTAVNTEWEEFIVGFQLAFTAVDLAYLLAWWEGGAYKLFVVHHAFVLTYEATVLLYHRGALNVMMIIWLGEVSSPVQNVWFIARRLSKQFPAAMAVYEATSPLYTVTYFLVRSLASPVALLALCWALVRDPAFRDGTLPYWVLVLWLSAMGMGLYGSQLWSRKLVLGYFKKRRKQQNQKRKLSDPDIGLSSPKSPKPRGD